MTKYDKLKKEMKVDCYKIHTIEIVVDRIVLERVMCWCIADSVEDGTALWRRHVSIVNDGEKDRLFNKKLPCHDAE